MLTVLYAPPGVGKGTLTVALAAAVTKGTALPNDSRAHQPADVLFVIAEDSAESTLRPRFEAADGDLRRAHVFSKERQLRFPKNIVDIEKAAQGCSLVIVDPLRGFFNGDSRKAMREVLVALDDMAARTGAAVLAVHHSTKGDDSKPLGSQDIVGIPRSVLLVTRSGAERELVQYKKNLAPTVASARFRIVSRGKVGAVEWVAEEPSKPPAPAEEKPAGRLLLLVDAPLEDAATLKSDNNPVNTGGSALPIPACDPVPGSEKGPVDCDVASDPSLPIPACAPSVEQVQDPNEADLDASTDFGAAAFQEKSHNRKLSPVKIVDGNKRKDGLRYEATALGPFCSSTYVSIQATCPDTCCFKRDSRGPKGCFADSGMSRLIMKRLDTTTANANQAIGEEVRAIDAAFAAGPVPQDGAKGGRDLRLHVGGDAAQPELVELLCKAGERWTDRGGGAVWTYTHAWRDVSRDLWGDSISVLASIERPEDAAAVRVQGYQPAIVVDQFPNGPRVFEEAGQKYVPCPAEINPGKMTCVKCRLCLDDTVLNARGLGIAFAIHGQHHNEARAALVQLRTPGAKKPAWQPQKFKCGLCGEIGHKRQRCPKRELVVEEEVEKQPDEQPEASEIDDCQVDSSEIETPITVNPTIRHRRKGIKPVLKRCVCCQRAVPYIGMTVCYSCDFCEEDEKGKLVPKGICPRLMEKTLRPITVEQVEEEKRCAAEKSEMKKEDRTVKKFRPEYEPF